MLPLTSRYDFDDMRSILFKIQQKPVPSLLRDLEKELNMFFKEAKCKEVIYTNNTDKMFFGMCVMPIIQPKDVLKVLQTDEKYIVNEYYIELDSKLFSPKLNMSASELLAVLLHEVGHMVNDSAPMEEVKNSIDMYLVKNRQTIALTDSIHYVELLNYGIKYALRQVTSMFETDDSEIKADEFVTSLGFGSDLESALKKVVANSYNINKDVVGNRLIALAWILRLYKDVKFKRIPAIRTMNRGKALTGSKLEKKEMDNVIRRLNRLDDDSLMAESVIDGLANAYSSTVKKFKYDGLKSFEQDYFEFSLRGKNLDDEQEAILLLHQINARMSIIDDYISTEKLDKAHYDRWSSLYKQYNTLRIEIANNTSYQSKSRLYISYPNGYND